MKKLVLILFMSAHAFAQSSSDEIQKKDRNYLNWTPQEKLQFQEEAFETLLRYNTEVWGVWGNQEFPIFSTNADWHSSVHSNWALLRLARSNPSLKDKMKQYVSITFPKTRIAREYAKFQAAGGEFELPYGRSWFLRFVIDYKTWCHLNYPEYENNFDSFANNVVRSLERLLRSNYILENLIVDHGGYHNSAWMLINLWDYYQFTNNTGGLNKIRNFLLEILTSYKDKIVSWSMDNSPYGQFFSKRGNVIILMSKVFNKSEFSQKVAEFLPQGDDLQLIPSGNNIFLAGIRWSRAMALRAILDNADLNLNYRSDLEKSLSLYINSGMRDFLLNESFSYIHWVPQFLIYTLITEEGVQNL